VIEEEGSHKTPAVGRVQFGDLRRVEPISSDWGYDRGLPIDRHYIEQFLARRAGDICGRVLDIGDDIYTRRFGGSRVTRSDVLDVKKGNPKVTIQAELTDAPQIPSNSFDCILLVETLHMIYDVRGTLQTVNRILAPNGVLLATFPGITRIEKGGQGNQWFWSFTGLSARKLLSEAFPVPTVTVEAHGNVLVAAAFLYGLAAEDLSASELACHDPNYELHLTARAVKS
jgi:SAM-dependent methyltransferase